MAAPKISVIMAAWNAEKTILGSIASVQAQTFSDWELVVADDGSTDKTAALVEKLAEVDSRVHLIRLEHGGAAKARNAAVRASNGAYLAVLDSDDASAPERLETQAAYMDAHPEVLAVGGWCRQCGRVWKPPCSNGAIQYVLAFGNPFAHSTVMIRRQVFGEGYRADLTASEDYEILARIGASGKVANLPKILSERALRPESIGVRLAREQNAIAANVAASIMKKRHPTENPALVEELARMNFSKVVPAQDRGELRALHARIVKACLESFPEDAREIRKFAAEHVAERRNELFGTSLREHMLRTCAVVRYYWRWPKSLVYLLLTETLGLKIRRAAGT